MYLRRSLPSYVFPCWYVTWVSLQPKQFEIQFCFVFCFQNLACFSMTTTPPSQEHNDLPQDKTSANKSISKSMQVYLERAREHEEFMKQQTHEYQIGKRHLANMMGEDPETFTQEDVTVTRHYSSGHFGVLACLSFRMQLNICSHRDFLIRRPGLSWSHRKRYFQNGKPQNLMKPDDLSISCFIQRGPTSIKFCLYVYCIYFLFLILNGAGFRIS